MSFPAYPLAYFTSAVAAERPVIFSRWGDGEWHALFGRSHGTNCDKHPYTLALGAALTKVLASRPSYLLGMQSLALSIFKDQIETYLQSNQLSDLNWIDADVFHNASERGDLVQLVAALKARPLLVVGPPHLRKLDKFLNYKAFVEVPARNSYASLTQIFNEVGSALDKLPAHPVVSVSAGMPGKLLVHELYCREGENSTILDFGSVWDYYAGVPSRKYMRRLPPFALS